MFYYQMMSMFCVKVNRRVSLGWYLAHVRNMTCRSTRIHTCVHVNIFQIAERKERHANSLVGYYGMTLAQEQVCLPWKCCSIQSSRAPLTKHKRNLLHDLVKYILSSACICPQSKFLCFFVGNSTEEFYPGVVQNCTHSCTHGTVTRQFADKCYAILHVHGVHKHVLSRYCLTKFSIFACGLAQSYLQELKNSCQSSWTYRQRDMNWTTSM